MDSHKPPKRAKEHRRTPRTRAEDLVAYYWTGSVPKPREVRDIGLYGAFIVGPETFYPGTVVQLVFEDRAAGRITGSASPQIGVYGRALRREPDGFPVSFLFGDGWERREFRRFLENLKREEPAVSAAVEPVVSGAVAAVGAAANESDVQTSRAQPDEPNNQGAAEGLQGGWRVRESKAG